MLIPFTTCSSSQGACWLSPSIRNKLLDLGIEKFAYYTWWILLTIYSIVYSFQKHLFSTWEVGVWVFGTRKAWGKELRRHSLLSWGARKVGGEWETEAIGGRRKTPPGTLPGGREGCFFAKGSGCGFSDVVGHQRGGTPGAMSLSKGSISILAPGEQDIWYLAQSNY